MDVFSGLLAPSAVFQNTGVDPLASQAGDGNLVGQYLQHLERLFPGCAWLTVPQVAACLKLSAGHIYNLHSTGGLPFKMTKFQSGRLRASVRDIAAYMDHQQAQMLQGTRPPRGTRLRWLQVSAQPTGAHIGRTGQDNEAYP